MNPEDGLSRIKVTWMPQIDGRPGSHFFVQYKKEMETQFLRTDDELNQDSIVVRGLDPEYTYHFRVVAVDGRHQTPSEVRQVYTYATLPPSGITGHGGRSSLAGSGWFIGMILAVLFLLLVCFGVCFIKMNRGGKYAVQEKEEKRGRRENFDEGGFPEYTQP